MLSLGFNNLLLGMQSSPVLLNVLTLIQQTS